MNPYDSPPRRAKIVATLGPASADPDVLRALLEAGVDVVRLNFSHGDHDFHRRALRDVRRIADELERFVPVLFDLMGPRYRLGRLDGTRQLEPGDRVRLGEGDDADLPVEDPSFLDHLETDERILVDNGLVELRVREKRGRTVGAEVVHGGPVSTRKGINLPDTVLPFTISEKDRADIELAVREGADLLAVSFVGGPDDVESVRTAVHGAGGVIPLVAKLERAAVVSRLDETVQAADAVMVARGDLGVEVPLHQVPVLQKRIVASCRILGKPVIVATQMLESMMDHPRPTRAESSDVANAVFDGADALMLSGETAAGAHPLQSVRTMVHIIEGAEAYRPPRYQPRYGALPDKALHPLLPGVAEREAMDPSRETQLEIADVVSAAAVQIAARLPVRHIVAFSQSGFTARMIARYRPEPPILAVTHDPTVARRVQLVWGTRQLILDHEVDHHDEVVKVVDRRLLETGLAQPGDTIVILMGDPIAEKPLTNLLRVHRVREE